jgi:hypothetical protein
MSLTWSKIKSPLLELDDKLGFGKLRGCRICDVVEDHYEYLIWAEKSGLVKYSARTIEAISRAAGFAEAQRHYEEEVVPYLQDVPY